MCGLYCDTDVLLLLLPLLQVYQKLLDAGLQPISTTYTALISAFGKAGQLDKAMETFQTMIQQGCERSVITYSALISACEKAGRWELALELFDQMQHEGCTPNTVTYNSLITACQQGRAWHGGTCRSDSVAGFCCTCIAASLNVVCGWPPVAGRHGGVAVICT
jgi:pentatricopeptide repeat protein